MLVKSKRFYPDFGFCHIYPYFPAKVGIKSFRFYIIPGMMLANY